MTGTSLPDLADRLTARMQTKKKRDVYTIKYLDKGGHWRFYDQAHNLPNALLKRESGERLNPKRTEWKIELNGEVIG